MEVAFAGGAFAEVAGRDPGWEIGVLQGLQFKGVGGAGGLGELGREGGGDGVLFFCSGLVGGRGWIGGKRGDGRGLACCCRSERACCGLYPGLCGWRRVGS